MHESKHSANHNLRLVYIRHECLPKTVIQLSSILDVNPVLVPIQLSSISALNAYRRTASGVVFMSGMDES